MSKNNFYFFVEQANLMFDKLWGPEMCPIPGQNCYTYDYIFSLQYDGTKEEWC